MEQTYYYFIGRLQDVFQRAYPIDTTTYPQFVLLTDDQVEYHLAHPTAKRWEIEHKDDPEPIPVPQDEPSIYDVMQDLKIFFNPQIEQMTDQQALERKSLMPTWTSFLDKQINAGERVWDDNRLWKCRQPHTVLANWRPADTPSLWEEISLEDGSHDHPIKYNNNMRLELGKFYTQYDVLYECIRDTEVPVYNDLESLINIYVMVSNN